MSKDDIIDDYNYAVGNLGRLLCFYDQSHPCLSQKERKKAGGQALKTQELATYRRLALDIKAAFERTGISPDRLAIVLQHYPVEMQNDLLA